MPRPTAQTELIRDRVTRAAVARLDGAIRSIVEFTVPTGTVLDWRGRFTDAAIPSGYLRCITDLIGSYAMSGSPHKEIDITAPGPYSGVLLQIGRYRQLYAVLGNVYGGSTANGTFRLPDETPATRIIKI